MLFLEIGLSMLALGLLLGFVGAGGSGFIIAVLTAVFGYPIHTALATALAAMVFTTLSGAFSHYREGNMVLKSGIIVGLFGAAGAWIGSRLAVFIPAADLHWMTAGMQFLSAAVLGIRLFLTSRGKAGPVFSEKLSPRYLLAACIIGIVTGGLSGTFGIGSTPFIQIGLMMVLGMPLLQAAGTTMLVILPIALSGGISYYSSGFLDIHLLIEVVVGTMLGSYIGAKFTRRVPSIVLRTAMILMPVIAGLMLLI
jgi:hypothetical protein